MLGELKRHFRDKGWAVHVPRATQELALKVSDALGTLPAKLGRSPRPRDVAEAVGRVRRGRARGDGGGHRVRGHLAGRPAARRDRDGDWTLGEPLADEEQGFELVEIGETLRGTLRPCPRASG